mgnify:CR=1 FL=1
MNIGVEAASIWSVRVYDFVGLSIDSIAKLRVRVVVSCKRIGTVKTARVTHSRLRIIQYGQIAIEIA